MDETKDADDDIDDGRLLFIGSNKEKFNTFRMPLNFLSDIDNAKTSLNKAEFEQKDLEKSWKSYNLTINQKIKKKKKKEMQY